MVRVRVRRLLLVKILSAVRRLLYVAFVFVLPFSLFGKEFLCTPRRERLK